MLFQSGFRPGYGMGLALITLLHDSWHGQDGNYVFILTLLDVSVAFDTFNHGILLD